MFCLSFEDGSSDNGPIEAFPYVYAEQMNVGRSSVDSIQGSYATFNGASSAIEIPYFTNNEFYQMSFSLWYKNLDLTSDTLPIMSNADSADVYSINIAVAGNTVIGRITVAQPVALLLPDQPPQRYAMNM